MANGLLRFFATGDDIPESTDRGWIDAQYRRVSGSLAGEQDELRIGCQLERQLTEPVVALVHIVRLAVQPPEDQQAD